MSAIHRSNSALGSPRQHHSSRGFALVVSLLLMILLVVLAMGLLTISSITLRASAQGEAMAAARANARFGLLLALGEIQKNLGDDRRISADASILDNAKEPNVVGVWRSWSPKIAENPLASPPDYDAQKTTNFVTWLASSATPEKLTKKEWPLSESVENPVNLFSEEMDGFRLSPSRVPIKGSERNPGTFAWAVVQDATRAKINVAGPEDSALVSNQKLHVQPRPSLAFSDSYNQPEKDWNQRSVRVISKSQAGLDKDLWKGPGLASLESAHFTAEGYGLLTDVIKGGLKTDLNLGFEMSSGDFSKDKWGEFKNPFRASTVPELGAPPSYQGQRPLFRPLTTYGSVRTNILFNPISINYEFPAASVPTFNTLRSYYRTPYHLYNTSDGPTVFERASDHVALRQTRGNIGPGKTPPAQASQTSYQPILDRVLYVLSTGLSSNDEIRLIITPIVTLWNPYNVALEIEGAVAYPWLDIPFTVDWDFYKNNTWMERKTIGLASIMGAQFISQNEGRSVNPYFYASITPDGDGIAGGGKSIRFKPGEVRVFAPSSPDLLEYVNTASIRQRTLRLGPVTNPSQLTSRGGLSVPLRNPINGDGFTKTMTTGDEVQVKFTAQSNEDFPYAIGLEDSTRIKILNPSEEDRGFSVAEVQTINFARSGATSTLSSPRLAYGALRLPASRQPFGIIETYHRVASDSVGTKRSDIVFTNNPRNPFINRYLSNGSFLAGPHYESIMRSVSNFNDVIQTDNNGRSAYYGPSNAANSGETELSFFEVPRSPLLSLASLQNADLSGTSFSTAYQFGNSWASAYLKKERAAELLPAGGGSSGPATYTRAQMPVYDYSYLANEALWDSFYFSGAAPTLRPGSTTGTQAVWNSDVASVSTDYKKALTNFIKDPAGSPLSNARMRFYQGQEDPETLKDDLTKPEGCIKLAAHLCVDGAFNINSTSEEAWAAVLGGMRDQKFEVTNGRLPESGQTPFPRFRDPFGDDRSNWMGFRSLSEAQIRDLAREIVTQVKRRGPFLSLGEFVNRRIDNSDLGQKGAVQAAIDTLNLNQSALYDTFNTAEYPADGQGNIAPANTGVGIPGYLTQADVLQSMAPVITVRSDTFTIRTLGEAKDSSGKVTASSWCEAVVQRTPVFVDESDRPETAVDDLKKAVNKTFGRRFSIISFRYLARNEIGPLASGG